jgi:GTPase SAR1 family protein
MLQVPILVFHQVIERASFENLKGWVEEVKSQRDEDVVIAVVGSKIDLTSNRYAQL